MRTSKIPVYQAAAPAGPPILCGGYTKIVGPRILISAGEASGDMYASALVQELRLRYPDAEFFGCAGPRMQAAGVEPVIDSRKLAVVGLVEVVAHIPRIYGEFRKLVRAAGERRPDLAILTDSPDFHLRLAKKLKRMGVPVIYLVAPQVWAWRKGRLPLMKRVIDDLFCIFPFEEPFFRQAGVSAHYIGHPLTRLVQPKLSREAFFEKHGLRRDVPLITLLPGSRRGEMGRHLPAVQDAVRRIGEARPAQFILAVPGGFSAKAGDTFFKERISVPSIQVVEGETWDAIAHADLALAASGTVTVEAALLGTPMVTFYRVTALSWVLGKLLVSVPFYSMVNLVAERRVVPELMQSDMTGERLAAEALRLLADDHARNTMREDLRGLRTLLATGQHPLERAADLIGARLERDLVHAS